MRRWQRLATLAIFMLTVALWMSGCWHGIPTAVVSFVPIAALVSNLMSNTAAANILLPVTIIIAHAVQQGAAVLVIPAALGCSAAMALPISTPPNALIYASGRLRGVDYLPVGLTMFLIGPPLAVAWVWLMR